MSEKTREVQKFADTMYTQSLPFLGGNTSFSTIPLKMHRAFATRAQLPRDGNY